MSAVDPRPDGMPLARAARERLRDQQQEETRRLATVLTAQDRLEAERSKAGAVIAKAERAISARQSTLDDAVLDLAATSGVERAAVLLDRPAGDVARLQRSRERARKSTGSARDREPDVPA